MGLLKRLEKQKMIVSFLNSGEIKPGRYLAIEMDYKTLPQSDPQQNKEEMQSWLSQLNGELLKGIHPQGRLLSGALGVSAFFEEYPAICTNTDWILPAQKEVLQAYSDALRPFNFYLMNRISLKIYPHSPIKYHLFHPVSISKAIGLLGPDKKETRNLEFTRIEPSSKLILPFTPQNHIKIYLHEPKGNSFVCTEDKIPIKYPAEYLRGVATQIGDTRIYVADPRYMYTKLNYVVGTKEKNFHKHEHNLRRLENFLAQHPKEYPIIRAT